MSEFNDNRQPRRRRTQLNAAQYAGQQTLDNSIPLIRTEDAPMQPTNPPRRNPQPPPAQQSANPPMQPMSAAQPMGAAQLMGGSADAPAGDESAGAGEPICAKRANARLPRRAGDAHAAAAGLEQRRAAADAAHTTSSSWGRTRQA